MSSHTNLLILPAMLPIATGFLLIPLRRRIVLQRIIALTAMLVGLALVIGIAVTVRRHGMLVFQAGNWPAPYGITLAVDLMPSLLMIMTMVTGTVCLLYSFRTIGEDKELFFYYPLYLIITGSINGAFMTGDLFNLFVFFELVLMTSYVLLSIGGRPGRLAETFKFLMLNSLSSAFFLVGVALVYRLTGTLNMADIALKMAQIEDKRMVTLTGLVFLFTFGVKAALVPLYFWLPRTYAEAPTAVTAYLGEVGTKVGVYALYRMFTLIFIHNVEFTHLLIMAIALITMVLGVMGAIAQMDFKRLLAFHIVSQIGYMILGLSFFSLDDGLRAVAVVGLAGGIIHIVHHMAAKPALFLLAGATEQVTGTTDLGRMQGLLWTLPALGFTFFMGGLSLTGVPPTSGFFSKFFLVRAGYLSGHYGAAAVAVAVSLLTLFSMIKIFRFIYWGQRPQKKLSVPRRFHARFLLPGAALVAVGLIMGFGAEVLIDMTTHAADSLLHPERYIEAVLGEGAKEQFLQALRPKGAADMIAAKGGLDVGPGTVRH